MNAIEEIEAARTKLIQQRENGTRGPWDEWHPGNNMGNSCVDSPTDDPDNPAIVVEGGQADIELIVTLYRTIDAQIKLLTGCVLLHAAFIKADRESDWLSAVERAGDLDLARAINGTA